MTKLKLYLYVIMVTGLSCLTCENVKELPKKDFRDFYGITWRGTAHDNLLFARQMGYDYVKHKGRKALNVCF